MKKSIQIHPDMMEPYVCSEIYSSTMLMGEDIVGEPAINLNQGVLKPYSRLPGNRHNGAEVYYVVECGEGAEVVTGTCEEGDEETHYKVKARDIIFIPAGVYHWINNKNCDAPFIVMTIWPKQEQNDVYYARKDAWGTSCRFAR